MAPLPGRGGEVIEYGNREPSPSGRIARRGDMLNGVEVLGAALAIFLLIWVAVLLASPMFGSPPEH